MFYQYKGLAINLNHVHTIKRAGKYLSFYLTIYETRYVGVSNGLPEGAAFYDQNNLFQLEFENDEHAQRELAKLCTH